MKKQINEIARSLVFSRYTYKAYDSSKTPKQIKADNALAKYIYKQLQTDSNRTGEGIESELKSYFIQVASATDEYMKANPDEFNNVGDFKNTTLMLWHTSIPKEMIDQVRRNTQGVI